jgi:hypothetical protein
MRNTQGRPLDLAKACQLVLEQAFSIKVAFRLLLLEMVLKNFIHAISSTMGRFETLSVEQWRSLDGSELRAYCEFVFECSSCIAMFPKR